MFDSTMITVVPRDNPLTLVLYDCGLVTSLPSFKQKSIADVFTAIVLADVSHDLSYETILSTPLRHTCMVVTASKKLSFIS